MLKAWRIAAVAAAAACGGDAGGPGGPVPGPLAEIIVSPASTTVAVDGTVTFHATELDSTGHFVLQYPINWGVTDQSVAQISDSGVALGLMTGTDTVLAVAQGKIGRAVLQVF